MPWISKERPLLADLILIAVTFLWGSSFITIKLQLGAVDPIVMNVYRLGLSAIVMALWLKFQKKSLWVQFSKGFWTGVCLWGMFNVQNVGMLYTSASHSSFITSLYVAFIPLFGIFFFGIHPKVHRLLGAVIALVGLWFLTGGYHNVNRGDAITLGNAVLTSIYVLLLNKYMKSGLDAFINCFQQFFVAAILSLVVALVFGLDFQVHSFEAMAGIVYLALFVTVLTLVVNAKVVAITSPMKVNLIYAMEPVFAAILAWVFGGETFTWTQSFGAACIVSAVLIGEKE